jgi:hypothetical protein
MTPPWEKVYESPDALRVQLLRAYLGERHDIIAVALSKQDSLYHVGMHELYVPTRDAVLAKFLITHEATAE